MSLDKVIQDASWGGVVTGGFAIHSAPVMENIGEDGLIEMLIEAVKRSGVKLENHDDVLITEAVYSIARSKDLITTVDDVAEHMRSKGLEGKHVGISHPFLYSRNRFMHILKAVAQAVGPQGMVTVLMDFVDQMGNPLVQNYNKYVHGKDNELYTPDLLREKYEVVPHPNTGEDYMKMYSDVAPHVDVRISGDEANMSRLDTDILIAGRAHSFDQQIEFLGSIFNGPVLGFNEFANEPYSDMAHNPDFGLIGSNKFGQLPDGRDRIKLFPDHYTAMFIQKAIEALEKEFGVKDLGVSLFGDGYYHRAVRGQDPVTWIRESADPVLPEWGFSENLGGFTPPAVKAKDLFGSNAGVNAAQLVELLAARQAFLQQSEATLDNKLALGVCPGTEAYFAQTKADLYSTSGDQMTPFFLNKSRGARNPRPAHGLVDNSTMMIRNGMLVPRLTLNQVSQMVWHEQGK